MIPFARTGSAAAPISRESFVGWALVIVLFLAPAASAQLRPLGKTVLPDPPGNGFLGLAPLRDGGVVVAWLDPDGNVKGQELAADLTVEHDFVVAPARGVSSSIPFCPEVAQIGRDRLAFSWLVLTPDDQRRRVAYRVVNADGSPSSPIRFAQDDVPKREEGCPHLSGGEAGFVISWTRPASPIGISDQMRARTFSLNGLPTSLPIDLALSMAMTRAPQVVIDSAGGFAAAWVPQNLDAEPEVLFLGRFQRDGTPIGRVVRVAAGVEDQIVLTGGTYGGFELIWRVVREDQGRTLQARRFDRNLKAISPVRTVFEADVSVVIPTAAVDSKARTALFVQTGGIVQGLALDPELKRCGRAISVSDDLPQGNFPVVVSAANQVTVAGVEASVEDPSPKLIVRRYGLPACTVATAIP